ncbi:heavy metal-associated isoprenylated plant protein 7-like [Phragmites australis]|uniref:heavy metal-associated isoprenylated plant protein 7-like n=1 Tax=Phragmites australis TaxID=29695 RepID=UPI002D799CF4|nr:heavy metal-associated isoprenylated plant protein 7-like [Phragmites australis]
MAREEELKRIDLKVNVSCCEGCRRKVMKAMSLKGVLRTEIQPSHDRVTVVGDVDVKVLVKKLAKIGKIAEVLAPTSEEGKKRDDGGKKDSDKPAPLEEKRKGKDDGKSTDDKAAAACKQECKKCAHEAARADDASDHANGKASSKDATANGKSAEEGEGAKSLVPDHAASQQHHYHRAEPAMVVPVHVPYYGYYATPPPPPMAMPMLMVPRSQQLRPQPSRFDEDFFNDDNTIGCRVM